MLRNEQHGDRWKYVFGPSERLCSFELPPNDAAVAAVVELARLVDTAACLEEAQAAAAAHLEQHPAVGAFLGMMATDGHFTKEGHGMSNQSTDPEQAAHPFAQFGGHLAVALLPRAYLGDEVEGADDGKAGARPYPGNGEAVDFTLTWTWSLANDKLKGACSCAPPALLVSSA